LTKSNKINRTREKHLKKRVDDGYFLYSQGLRTTIVLILFLEEKACTFQVLSGQSGVQKKSEEPVTRGIGVSFMARTTKVWTHS